jgi:Tfp pilus assembly protein PilX
MCRPPSSRQSEGFTLAEVMIALLFLTVAIFGLISVHIYAARAQSVSEERQVASVLAVSELQAAERKLRHDFNERVPVTIKRARLATNPEFEREVLVQPVVGYSTLKRVEVNLYWQDQNGPKQHQIWTYIYDRSR